MAVDAEAICNSALIKIGASKIAALSDTNKRAILCNEQYPKLRDDLLRSHPWNFAIKRKVLSADSFIFVDGDVITGADTITETAHTRETGDKLRLTSSGILPTPLELSTDYYVIFVDANTFKLATTAANANAGTAIDITAAAGGGNHTITMKPNFEYDNIFLLPSDYMRAVRLEDKEDIFTVEGNRIFTNESQINLVYIARIIDTTKFDKNFDELLALMLANELSYPLVQSNSLKATLQQELAAKLRDIRSFDAQEGNAEELEANTWTNSRL